MTILSFHLAYSEGKGTKLGEGERDFRDYYANPNSGRLRSGLFCSGIVGGTFKNLLYINNDKTIHQWKLPFYTPTFKLTSSCNSFV
jgi:hypothetical protein